LNHAYITCFLIVFLCKEDKVTSIKAFHERFRWTNTMRDPRSWQRWEEKIQSKQRLKKRSSSRPYIKVF